MIRYVPARTTSVSLEQEAPLEGGVSCRRCLSEGSLTLFLVPVRGERGNRMPQTAPKVSGHTVHHHAISDLRESRGEQAAIASFCLTPSNLVGAQMQNCTLSLQFAKQPLPRTIRGRRGHLVHLSNFSNFSNLGEIDFLLM